MSRPCLSSPSTTITITLLISKYIPHASLDPTFQTQRLYNRYYYHWNRFLQIVLGRNIVVVKVTCSSDDVRPSSITLSHPPVTKFRLRITCLRNSVVPLPRIPTLFWSLNPSLVLCVCFDLFCSQTRIRCINKVRTSKFFRTKYIYILTLIRIENFIRQ